MSIKELGEIRTESNLKTTVNMTLVDTKDFDIDIMKKYFDPKYFLLSLVLLMRMRLVRNIIWVKVLFIEKI